MDFRSSQQQPVAHPAAPAGVGGPTNTRHEEVRPRSHGNSDGPNNNSWLRWLNVIILFGIAILILGMIFAFTRGNDNESKFVKTGDTSYQAVFLNNGQVYFGKIQTLNGSYINLTDIYYLTQNGSNANATQSSSSNSNYTLVKLGCQQIHDPMDQMIINKSQVSFWENLNEGGKVVKSIEQFQKQNPKGPDCSQTSTQTQASNTNTQNATNPTTNKQPSTTTPSKK